MSGCNAQGRIVTLGSHILRVKNMEEKVLGMKSKQCAWAQFPEEMKFTRWLCLCPWSFSSLNKFKPVGRFLTKFNTGSHRHKVPTSCRRAGREKTLIAKPAREDSASPPILDTRFHHATVNLEVNLGGAGEPERLHCRTTGRFVQLHRRHEPTTPPAERCTASLPH